MTDDPLRTNSIQSGQPVQPVQPSGSSNKPQADEGVEGASFAETFSQQVRFSNHAQKRIERRNLNLTDDGLARLNDAVEKAQKRGGRESLVLMDDMAFIVNVRERLVVTALDRNRSGDGVFTQIDSVVLADKSTTETPSTMPTDAANTATDPQSED